MEASCFALTFGHTVPALSRPCACETVRNTCRCNVYFLGSHFLNDHDPMFFIFG